MNKQPSYEEIDKANPFGLDEVRLRCRNAARDAVRGLGKAKVAEVIALPTKPEHTATEIEVLHPETA